MRVPIERARGRRPLRVRPGEKIATDGVVESTAPPRSTRRCSPARAVPVEVGPGDAVTGATVNAGGRLVVRATRSAPTPPSRRSPGWSTEAQIGQGAGAAARRPGLRRVRAGRASRSPSARSGSGWPPASGAGRVHRGGRRADHRLPVRARPGHADRAARRHRPRRAARHPHQGPEVLESTRRVDTIVLDKTGTVTTGRMTLVDVVAADGVDARRRAAPRRRARGRAREHPIAPRHRGRRRASTAPLPPVESLRQPRRASASSGVVDGQRVVVGPAQPARRLGDAARRRAARRATAEARRAAPSIVAAGTARPAALLVVADTVEAHERRGDRRARAARAAPGAAHRRQRRRSRARSPQRSASTDVSRRGPARRQGRRRSRAPGARAASSRWSATASTTPPRWRRPTSGIAMGTGTDVAIEASDLTLVRGDLRAAADAIRLSRRTLAHDQGQPVLGVRLQRRRPPARRGRPAQPADRRARRWRFLASSSCRTACGCAASPRGPSDRSPRRGSTRPVS